MNAIVCPFCLNTWIKRTTAELVDHILRCMPTAPPGDAAP